MVAKPIGRPRKAPMHGKGFVLSTRITADTRAALEVEAKRTGRSMSQVAELWMEDGRFFQAWKRSVMADHDVATALEAATKRIAELEAELANKRMTYWPAHLDARGAVYVPCHALEPRIPPPTEAPNE